MVRFARQLLCTGVSWMVWTGGSLAQPPANTLNVVIDGGAAGDGVTDDAASIQALLEVASAQDRDLYFPPGTYLLGTNITTRKGVSLYGDRAGLSILRSAPGRVHFIGNREWSSPSSNLDVEDLFFLNCNLDWYGSESVRKNIHVRRCLFFGNDPAFSTTAGQTQFQIILGHVVDGTVEDCIFLRQANCFGDSVSGYKNVRQVHRHCVWGLHLDRVQWLASQWPRYAEWSDLPSKLQTIRTRFGLDADQGHFRSGLKINGCTASRVEYNVFNGSPYTPATPVNRDHVIYAHGGYTDLDVLGNWMRGWPSAPNGGLKIRNTHGTTTVIANHFVNTPVLQYAYANNDPQAYENAIIHRNHFQIYQNFSDNRLGISFWETVDGVPPQINNEYSANLFECPRAYATAINLTNGDLAGHTAYDSNVFLADGTPVTTAHQQGAFPLVPGAPDPSRTAPYDGFPIPTYDIPVFGSAPAFTTDPVVKTEIPVGTSYTGTLADNATDAEGEGLEFMKMSGPSWLSVDWDGTLSGTPGPGDLGLNRFTVRVGDNRDGMDEAELQIRVAGTNGQVRVTLAPVADSHTSQENPDDNFGEAAYLNVRNGAYDTALRPYLRFSVPASDWPIARVYLRLYCSRGTHTLRLHEVGDVSWTESGITWRNAPALGAILASRAVGTDAWEAFDLSAHVTAGGEYALGLDSSSASYRQVDSREGANPPVLDVVYGDPQADTDGDGMPDWWEVRYFQGTTNALAHADADGDGLDNLSEFIAGCHPTNPASRFMLRMTVEPAGFAIRWDAQEGRVYDVERCDDPSSGGFTSLVSDLYFPQNSVTQDLDPASLSRGFYRATVHPP